MVIAGFLNHQTGMCFRKVLKNAKTRRGEKTTTVDFSPKAISTNELYGFVNMQTREWKDGIISKAMWGKVWVSEGLSWFGNMGMKRIYSSENSLNWYWEYLYKSFCVALFWGGYPGILSILIFLMKDWHAATWVQFECFLPCREIHITIAAETAHPCHLKISTMPIDLMEYLYMNELQYISLS